MRFEHPLFLLLFIPYFWMLYAQFSKLFVPTIQFSNVAFLRKIEHRSTKYISRISRFLKYIILALMIITLSKPQLVDSNSVVSSEGLDIVLVMDTSGSMAAEDLQPDNRLAVAKETIKDFVAKRTSDRIGLVVFGSDAYTQCPLTTDYGIIRSFIDDVELSMAGNGTAIGMGIAVGLNRLKDSEAKSKVLILLTDGENNAGTIDPLTASLLARDLDIKIYTIGVGKEGAVPVPIYHPVFGKTYTKQVTRLDEDMLKEISFNTNGSYFRATDSKSLKDIYEQIDDLEKTEIKTNVFEKYNDLFPVLLKLIFALMLLEVILFNIVFVVTP